MSSSAKKESGQTLKVGKGDHPTSDEEADDRKPSPQAKRAKVQNDRPSRSQDSPSGGTSSDEEDESDQKLSPKSKRAREEEGLEGETPMTEDRKLEAKRAYNRANAARARKRVKEQLVELCQKVEQASDKHDKLKAKNDELEKLVLSLTEENQLLRRVLTEQRMTSGISAGSRVEESEALRRMYMEGGAARLPAGTSNLGGLPPGLQQNMYQLPQGSSSSMAHPPSQQLYPYFNQGDARLPWNHPSLNPDGKTK